MKVLFLTPRSLAAAKSGGTQVSLERAEGLASVGSVTAAHLHHEDQELRGRVLGATSRDLTITVAGHLRPRNSAALVASYAAGLPLSVWRNSHPAYLKHVAALGEQRWDIVYVDHWLVWEAARHLDGARKILHLHNAEPELFRRAAAGLKGAQRCAASLEYGRVVRFLRRVVEEVDELHLLSGADRAALEAVDILHPLTRVFLPAVPFEARGPIGPFQSRRSSALFVGSLSWLPNSEGLRWYLETVWQERKAVRSLDIAGGGASPALRSLAERTPGVRAHGFVENLSSLYSEARCLVAPLLSGSGIKIKIINALAHGLPVVTTSTGVEGLPENGGGGVFVADSPALFSSHVDMLVTDAAAWGIASEAAKEYAVRNFSGADFLRWCGELGANRAVRYAS